MKTELPSDLNKLLKQFYANVLRVDGEYYNRSSMCIIRQSINRHLKQPPHSKPYDIMTGFEFKEANNTFKAIYKKLRKEGKGQVEHKRSVEKGDIKRLYEHSYVFNTTSPSGLLNKVCFEVLLYFCRRGQGNLRDMKPSDFEVSKDDSGKHYVHKTVSEVTKHHQGVDNENYEPEGGRIYATGTIVCPVSSFQRYLSKLNPKCSMTKAKGLV